MDLAGSTTDPDPNPNPELPTAEPLSVSVPHPTSRYEAQKRRDWKTFLKYLSNQKPPLTLSRCSGADVIEFLRYLDRFGKTKVHVTGCSNFGHLNPPAPCACQLKQAWGSLDAIIGRLRAAYEENGGQPQSNPFGACAVRIYLREVRESQAKARGVPYEKKRKRPSGGKMAVVKVSVDDGGDDISRPQIISPESRHKSSRIIKGAPLETLFAQFCLHSLWFGDCNIRAIAVLWIEFIREVRWCWEESQPLPRMPTNATIDLSTCLVNQKLQMLAICIEKRRKQVDSHQGGDGDNSSDSPRPEARDVVNKDTSTSDLSRTKEGLVKESESTSTSDDFQKSEATTYRFTAMPHHTVTSVDSESSNGKRRGSAGLVESMMLLKSRDYMHAPFTQDPPIMTEDMHEERLRAVEVLGDSFNFSGQLEKDILASDMSAFKAANPDAVFEDFIRWHSPKDWEDDNSPSSRKKWPPGGRLSDRMSDPGNSWRKIWNDAPSLPASEQKPLMDPNREGEKILHYLER